MVTRSYYETANLKLIIDRGFEYSALLAELYYYPKVAASQSLTIKYCTKYDDSHRESALLVERWTFCRLDADHLRLNTILCPASGYLHCIVNVQQADLLTQQWLGPDSGSPQLVGS